MYTCKDKPDPLAVQWGKKKKSSQVKPKNITSPWLKKKKKKGRNVTVHLHVQGEPEILKEQTLATTTVIVSFYSFSSLLFLLLVYPHQHHFTSFPLSSSISLCSLSLPRLKFLADFNITFNILFYASPKFPLISVPNKNSLAIHRP